MNLNYLTKPVINESRYAKMVELAKKGVQGIRIIGPADSQKVHLSYVLGNHTGMKMLYLTYNEVQARKVHSDFDNLTLGNSVLFPAGDALLYSVEARSHDSMNLRIAAFAKILSGQWDVVVASVESFAQKLNNPFDFAANMKVSNVGESTDLYDLNDWLISVGYEKTVVVEGKGQFSVRGGILDVFTPSEEYPLRIEFIDNLIDSIRSFDPITQRSIAEANSALFLPAREVILPDEQKRMDIADRIRNDNKNQHNFEEELYKIETGIYFTGIDKYIPYIIEKSYDLIDYISASLNGNGKLLVFADEPERMVARLKSLHTEYNETCSQLIEKGNMLPGGIGFYFSSEDIFLKAESFCVIYLETIKSGGRAFVYNFNLQCRQLPPTEGKVELLTADLKRWKERGCKVVVLAGTSKARAERIAQTLTAEGVMSAYYEQMPPYLSAGQVYVTTGNLEKGFEYVEAGFVVVAEGDITTSGKTAKKERRKRKGISLSSFADLKIGDFVVHDVHGIGKYEGIEKIIVDGVVRDYLKILYHQNSRLFVPVQQLNIVQKYVGSEGRVPRLNKLGSGEWDKTKARVRESLKGIAQDLIALYAERQRKKGFAFSKDTIWQRQFEDEFPFEETDDQLKCISEIKVDMESERPMDRLLCGDVGYGKTEVGLRAVFKAALDGKQSAWLVPTTILAQQHYESFKKRFEGYPINVEMLSRFRSRAEQNTILASVSAGKTDVLVGTHRLLQKDLKFKNPGILVIDEEHRFGVAHKEKLKTLYPDVDVLSLSATPIPRTLHMSLAGIRDISTIDEPPESRYPVQTYVMEYDEELLKDAIYRELSRDGQVFYLFNRVRNIEEKAADIQKMVPDARVIFAHGRMDEKELEEMMLNFIRHDSDILVCTTIIESGLDMGNVNTIIIEDADRLGLAQLYQLRGRVGRAGRLSYAYVTYRKDKVLSEIAEKRLQAIREFTEFGSGFRIAMRDMEIRGAGNILGSEQHGHMETVGYEMYCRLLAEAVGELNNRENITARANKTTRTMEETLVEIGISAYISDEYIAEESNRIEIYGRIADIEAEEDLLDVRDELLDRYGKIPPETESLCKISLIRAFGTKCGFSSIQAKRGRAILKYRDDKKIDIMLISKLVEKHKGEILFTAGNPSYITFLNKSDKDSSMTDIIISLLEDVMEPDVMTHLEA